MSDKVVELRQRLADLRNDVLDRLAEGDVIDAGLLAVAANATVVLLAWDEPDPSHAHPREAVEAEPARPRGGDHHREQRRERDDGILALVSLTCRTGSAEAKAREVAGRLARFQPMPVETEPARQLMRQILDSGVPVPDVDRLARIIRSGEQSADSGEQKNALLTGRPDSGSPCQNPER